MTNEDRQAVIDALEHASKFASSIESDEADGTWLKIGEALAIMQREREPVAWMSSERLNAILSKAQYKNCALKNRGEYSIPLYKD